MGKKDESSSGSSSGSDSDKKEDKKEKKTKQKKAKQVIASSQSFSKRYSATFNNKHLSDFTVTIGDTSYATHKIILCSNSEHFEKLAGESSFSFPKEDDAEAAKSLIKFYYEGIFEYTDDSAVVIFTLLANKYKTKNFGEFKLPAKVLLNGIITYVEKDLTNRQSEFDTLCESVNFKKMEKEDLQKLYSKKKWLQKSSSFLNQIILKDMDDGEDGSGSEKDSEEGSDKESEESEEEEESGGGIPKFMPKLSSSSCSYSNKNRTATYQKSSWAGTILASKSNKWATKLGQNCGYLMVGMAPKTINKDTSNYSSNGYYLYTSTGGMYGTGGLSNKSFTQSDYNVGTVYGFVYDKKKGTLTIYKNGQKLGVAVDNIKKLELYPAFDFLLSRINSRFSEI
jgi:hypothetical protein